MSLVDILKKAYENWAESSAVMFGEAEAVDEWIKEHEPEYRKIAREVRWAKWKKKNAKQALFIVFGSAAALFSSYRIPQIRRRRAIFGFVHGFAIDVLIKAALVKAGVYKPEKGKSLAVLGFPADDVAAIAAGIGLSRIFGVEFLVGYLLGQITASRTAISWYIYAL